MGWSLASITDAPKIEALLAEADAQNASRTDFVPAISREAAMGTMLAVLWMYGCRPTETSAMHAMDALYRSLGIDWMKSTLVPLEPRP